MIFKDDRSPIPHRSLERENQDSPLSRVEPKPRDDHAAESCARITARRSILRFLHFYRFVFLTAFLIMIAQGARIVAPHWYHGLPKSTKQHIIDYFLFTIGAAYPLAIAIASVATVGLTRSASRDRRERIRARVQSGYSKIKMRLLASSIAVIACVPLVEAGSAAFWNWKHRSPTPLAFRSISRRSNDRTPAIPERDLRVVVVGGSSAAGYPFEEPFSIGRIVAGELQPYFPDRNVRAVVLAEEGATLESQHKKLAAFAEKPDVLIIYIGDNEYISRFEWKRTVRPKAELAWPGGLTRPGELEAIFDRLARVSRFERLVREAIDRNRLDSLPPIFASRELVDLPPCDEDETAALHADFRARLEAIVDFAIASGAIPILISPCGNDADFEPNRSILIGPYSDTRWRKTITSRFHEAIDFERSDPDRAAALYSKLLDEHPEFAEAHYRLASLARSSGDAKTAARHYRAARDLDGFPFRCPEPFRAIYRAVAAERNVPLIDAQKLFESLVPDTILDDRLFMDGVHPSVSGQVALAEAVLARLFARRYRGVLSGEPPILNAHEIARRRNVVGPSVWKKLLMRSHKYYMAAAGVRYDPIERVEKAKRYRDAANRIALGETPEGVVVPDVELAREKSTESQQKSPKAGTENE